MRTRDVGPSKARVYAEKARRFEAAAKEAFKQGHWDPAVSAAVHAAISAVDAVCVLGLGKRAAAEDHDEALTLLGQVPSIPQEARAQAAKHFKSLLSMKHVAEYEDRLCDKGEAERAMRDLSRAMTALRRGLPQGEAEP